MLPPLQCPRRGCTPRKPQISYSSQKLQFNSSDDSPSSTQSFTKICYLLTQYDIEPIKDEHPASTPQVSFASHAQTVPDRSRQPAAAPHIVVSILCSFQVIPTNVYVEPSSHTNPKVPICFISRKACSHKLPLPKSNQTEPSHAKLQGKTL